MNKKGGKGVVGGAVAKAKHGLPIAVASSLAVPPVWRVGARRGGGEGGGLCKGADVSGLHDVRFNHLHLICDYTPLNPPAFLPNLSSLPQPHPTAASPGALPPCPAPVAAAPAAPPAPATAARRDLLLLPRRVAAGRCGPGGRHPVAGAARRVQGVRAGGRLKPAVPAGARNHEAAGAPLLCLSTSTPYQPAGLLHSRSMGLSTTTLLLLHLWNWGQAGRAGRVAAAQTLCSDHVLTAANKTCTSRPPKTKVVGLRAWAFQQFVNTAAAPCRQVS